MQARLYWGSLLQQRGARTNKWGASLFLIWDKGRGVSRGLGQRAVVAHSAVCDFL